MLQECPWLSSSHLNTTPLLHEYFTTMSQDNGTIVKKNLHAGKHASVSSHAGLNNCWAVTNVNNGWWLLGSGELWWLAPMTTQTPRAQPCSMQNLSQAIKHSSALSQRGNVTVKDLWLKLSQQAWLQLCSTSYLLIHVLLNLSKYLSHVCWSLLQDTSLKAKLRVASHLFTFRPLWNAALSWADFSCVRRDSTSKNKVKGS